MIIKHILLRSFRILKKNRFLNVFDLAYSTIKSFKSLQDEKDINIINVCQYNLKNFELKDIPKNSRKIKELSQIMLLETQVEFKRQMNNKFNEDLFNAKESLNKTLEEFQSYLKYNIDFKNYFLSKENDEAKNEEIKAYIEDKKEKIKILQEKQNDMKDIFTLINS